MSALIGDTELVAALDGMATAAIGAGEVFVLEGLRVLLELLQDLVPVDTGALRSSFVTDGPWPVESSGMVEGRVFPTKIYARRRDRGFHGVDSLGRHYQEDGVFYMERAIREAEDILAELWQEQCIELVTGLSV